MQALLHERMTLALHVLFRCEIPLSYLWPGEDMESNYLSLKRLQIAVQVRRCCQCCLQSLCQREATEIRLRETTTLLDSDLSGVDSVSLNSLIKAPSVEFMKRPNVPLFFSFE